jgi:glycosyltransferase involved in cell wall biosynthesis
MKRLRIAMIGQKGLPATFGGVERHVEELGCRLAARGHDVVVYNRPNYAPARLREYKGMSVRTLPTVPSKHLDTMVHSLFSTASALTSGVDIVHYHALGPGVPAVLPRYGSAAQVVLTVHGLDSERAKWGRAARTLLRGAEWLSARVPDATIVVSRALVEHYARRHHRSTWYIPNGVDKPASGSRETVERLGISPGSYLLFVGRLVPEKAPDLLIRAFRRVPGDARLVIAGGSSFTDEYVDSLRALAAADPRVLLAGYVFGPELEALYANAAAFVLPSLLEGLPLTLLEAASHATPIIASDIAPHLEVLGFDAPGRRLVSAGDEDSLAQTMQKALEAPAEEKQGAVELRDEVLQAYRWEDTVDATEALYEAVMAEAKASRRKPAHSFPLVEALRRVERHSA